MNSFEKNDLKLVDEILRQNLADINLYLKQVKEYKSLRDTTEFRNITKYFENKKYQ